MSSVLLLAGFALAPLPPAAAPPWGYRAHEMATRVAVATLPTEMPAFFREAGAQLAYLSVDPDRWRSGPVAMNEAWRYDHYVDLENVPAEARQAPDRFTYLGRLFDAGLEEPAPEGGLLPYRILELYQRMAEGWRRWEAESDPERRLWIEARIVDDAGLLSHYVTDASQPHHTTIHFDGWNADTPNPADYTTRRGFHSRFERDYVDARVTHGDVRSRVPASPGSVAGNAVAAVWRFIDESHATVEELYRLDRDVGFDPDGPFRPEARDFAAERLAAGAAMLATLWWSAWQEGTGG